MWKQEGNSKTGNKFNVKKVATWDEYRYLQDQGCSINHPYRMQEDKIANEQ